MSADIWPGIGLSAQPENWRKFFEVPSSAKSTAAVERKRREGKDNSTIRGLSRKERRSHAPVMMRGPSPGYGMRAESTAGRVRALLASGPMTRRELSDAAKIAYKDVNGFISNDVRQGRIVVLRDVQPIRYALPGAAC